MKVIGGWCSLSELLATNVEGEYGTDPEFTPGDDQDDDECEPA